MKFSRAALLPLLALAAAGADAPASAPPDTLNALNTNFSLPNGHLRFVPGEGGLPCAQISTPQCTARIYLLGAHVAAWQPAGHEPVLLMSSKSAFAPGKPIRGGIPVIFPWFATNVANPAAPNHGLLRTRTWDVESTREEAGAVTITFVTRSDEQTRTYYPHAFEARLRATFGTSLEVALEIKNTDPAPITFEEALHTYYAVGDVRRARVTGLDKTDYLDKVDALKQKPQAGDIIFTSETDRIYLNTKTPLQIIDEASGRKITIEKSDSNTTVVWNPGPTKVVADLGPGEWSRFVCAETANLSPAPVTLPPGGTHAMSFRATVNK
jgi:glucose-6-phosphate 1-epimerase